MEHLDLSHRAITTEKALQQGGEGKDYYEFLLYLADSSLVLAQRNAGWCGHGPILEQDIALTNITLDHIGQARNFYQLAATLINETEEERAFGNHRLKTAQLTEDDLAYLRTEREFRNLLVCELPRGDWAFTVLRLCFFSLFTKQLYTQLAKSSESRLAAIAAKSLRETEYHVKWSSEWVIRLGDGTAESRQRLLKAFEELWPYTGELFMHEPFEHAAGISSLPTLKMMWLEAVTLVFLEAGIAESANSRMNRDNVFMQQGGKRGIHTEHLGGLLAEMQYLQRAYPGAQW